MYRAGLSLCKTRRQAGHQDAAMKAPSHGTPLGEPCARNLQDGSTCSTLQNRTRAGNVPDTNQLISNVANQLINNVANQLTQLMCLQFHVYEGV
eukprot:m.305576 g.305576  ORF g.305576 m.305576 type:complete len:94 (-) comp15909_c4_seq2:342-623(-)